MRPRHLTTFWNISCSDSFLSRTNSEDIGTRRLDVDRSQRRPTAEPVSNPCICIVSEYAAFS